MLQPWEKKVRRQLEKGLQWVLAHRSECCTLTDAIYRAAWRYHVDEQHLLKFVREHLQQAAKERKRKR